MTTQERVEELLSKINDISRRRSLWDDEKVEQKICVQVIKWLEDDRRENERIEAEAAAAEDAEIEQRRLNDPNYQTKELFGTYRKKLQKEGRMR